MSGLERVREGVCVCCLECVSGLERVREGVWVG